MNEGLRVLVVDDDWQMAKTLADVLTLKGFEAEAACSSNGAREMLEEDRFDCVVTDRREQTSSEVQKARGLNVQGTLCKPFEAEELLEVVSHIRRNDLAAVLRGCPGMLVSQMLYCRGVAGCLCLAF